MWKSLSDNLTQLRIDEENRKALDRLLEPIDHLSIGTESDYSDLEDPFEEFHKNSIMKNRKLTKREADIAVMNSFTKDFLETLNEIKKDTKQIDFVDEDEVAKVFEMKPESLIPAQELRVDCSDNFERSDDDEAMSGSTLDSMVWRLLKANSGEKFKVSSVFYNAYHQNEPHWLDRPDISWDTVNDSVKKCESWMEANENE